MFAVAGLVVISVLLWVLLDAVRQDQEKNGAIMDLVVTPATGRIPLPEVQFENERRRDKKR